MVFIKPIIINNQTDAKDQTLQQYDYIRYQQIRKQNGLGLSKQEGVLPYQAGQKDADLPAPFANGNEK